MEEEIMNITLPEVKKDLYMGIVECNKRGLVFCAKWLSEMSHGLQDTEMGNISTEEREDLHTRGISKSEFDNYYLAKSYFDTKEYDRAAYFTSSCESPVPRFLHLYSLYMAKEKKRLDNMSDYTDFDDSGVARDLSELLAILKSEYSQRKLDGYGLYLYGIVLKKLDLSQAALNIFLESIHNTPILWNSWIEMCPLMSDKEKLLTTNLPKHWIKHIFIGHTYTELFLNDEAIKQFEELQAIGLQKCIYITAEIALAYHNKRDVDKAIEIFQTLQEKDPYRLENLDTYSNLLFVKEMKAEMATLAHKVVEINKYRPETCCVIGNYYSIRCDHQKAIIYFQRALKLNPRYLSAWTLMGHEFMELKNTNAAIQSYRKAVEVNKRDYRAWYGLGQSYEILKMHYYSLYYFKIAHQLRPYDSRMLVALGETYEKLDKNSKAIKCFQRACNVGDIEGIALYKLAHLLEKLGEIEKAIPAYLQYCTDERAIVDKVPLYNSFMTLANYYEDKGNYEEAQHFAYKCLESEEKKNEAKGLLKIIENKRSTDGQPLISQPCARDVNTDCSEVWMDESDMVTENSENEKNSNVLNNNSSTMDTNFINNNSSIGNVGRSEVLSNIARIQTRERILTTEMATPSALASTSRVISTESGQTISTRSTTASETNEDEDIEEEDEEVRSINMSIVSMD